MRRILATLDKVKMTQNINNQTMIGERIAELAEKQTNMKVRDAAADLFAKWKGDGDFNV